LKTVRTGFADKRKKPGNIGLGAIFLENSMQADFRL